MAKLSEKIDNPEVLEKWLVDKPVEWRQALATRAALRALPLVLGLFDLVDDKLTLNVKKRLTLQAVRASFISWCAGTYPDHNLSVFAAAAVANNEAISSAADANEIISKAISASFAAAAIIAAPRTSVAAAVATTDDTAAAFDDTWSAITADAQWLSESESERLMAQPLWLIDVRGNSSYLANFPLSARKSFDSFNKSDLVKDGLWGAWIAWYRGLLPDTPRAIPKSHFGQGIDLEIATQESEFWERDPDEVMKAISRIIQGEASSRNEGEQPATESTLSDASEDSTTTWLAQYNQGKDRVSQWVNDAGPGSKIDWKVGRAKIDAMKPGDGVIYWRTVTKGRDRGGIVGTGIISSTDAQEDENGIKRVATTVAEFYDDNPLSRDEVINVTGLRPGSWQFSLYQIPADIVVKINALLSANGRKESGIWPSQSASTEQVEITFIGDAPKRDEDFLGRADLAFMLAARLNRVWDEMNNTVPKSTPCDSPNENSAYDTGFVVHIDAPWGGGKTSFANYLTRILNPYRLPAPLPAVLTAVPINDENYWPVEFRRPWHIVTFNAWQHQHVDPPWWCFYQAIRKETFHATRTESWDLGDNRLKAANVAPPPNWLLRHLKWSWCWTREICWRLFHPKIRMLLSIAVPTLLISFLAIRYGILSFDCSKDKLVWSFDSWPPLFLAGASLFLGATSGVWAFVSVITESLFPGTPAAAKNYSLGAGDPLERFRTHFARSMSRLKRPVLVVVDDIDRCEPNFVVELVRGIQTILRSPRVVFLILGDRDWIEHAFAETHKAMKGIDVGPEHSFGSRFVEKAIQLSVVLPDIPTDERSAYVRNLLGVEERRTAAVEQLTDEQREEVKESLRVLDSTADPVERDKSAADIRARVWKFEAVSEEIKEAVAKTIDRQAALRSAADEKLHAATQHRLEPISKLLPPNPRQIKRIINAIALFQEIARARMEVQPDTKPWRQLALWIVLMIEWPQTWMTLSKWPDLITHVHDESSGIAIDDLDVATITAWVKAIRSKPYIMALVDYPSVDGVPDKWKDCKIDAEAIYTLKIIVPPTSGEPLPKPKNGSES